MKATVAGINLNAKHNGKAYVEFITQADPYNGVSKPPRTHKLFSPYKDDLIAVVKTLSVGDRVEYTTDNTQYRNMDSLTKMEDSVAPSNAAAPKGGGFKRDDSVTKSIARAAAMKEATQLVLFGAKKTEAVENLAAQVMDLTTVMEKFLLFETENDEENEEVEEGPGF